MKNHGVLSRLTYTTAALLSLVSFTIMGCGSGATPTPTTNPSSTPTATVAPHPTPTPTPTASGTPQYGGTLKIAENIEADYLGYPAKMVSLLSVTEGAPALETLLRFDQTGNTVPWLAAAFTADVGSKTITFTLRKGIKFHDGTDFNAEAVKWNLNQWIAAKASATSTIASMDVVDDYTLGINLNAWSSIVMGNFAQAAGLMVSPTAFQTNGLDWSTKHPIGTGPFKFASWNPGATISYNRFDGYWQQGKPYLDGVQIVLIQDDLTREVSLRAGEVEVAYELITTDLAKLQSDGFVNLIRPRGVAVTGLAPDSANPKSPFADVRVRQATAYAIDNAALIKSIFGVGGATITNQLTFPGYWAYDPSIVGYPYDPAKAKQLLAAAGYPNGFQTRMESWGDTQRVSYATGVQSYLKAVGIDATINILTQIQITSLQVSGKSWQGLAVVRSGANPDWISQQSTIYNGNGSYVDMLVPDDYSQAIKDAVTAPDFQTKQKLAQKANKLAVDQYCIIIPELCLVDTESIWPYVHGTGLFETNSIVWTPENAWLAKH